MSTSSDEPVTLQRMGYDQRLCDRVWSGLGASGTARYQRRGRAILAAGLGAAHRQSDLWCARLGSTRSDDRLFSVASKLVTDTASSSRVRAETIADIVTKLHKTGTHPPLEKLRQEPPGGRARHAPDPRAQAGEAQDSGPARSGWTKRISVLEKFLQV